MDKVYVDINVIKGILSSYRRASENQTRIYGLILGSKKNNIYHITEAVYGYIFEGREDPKTNKKELIKINDESLKSLFNSLQQKLKMNNPNINAIKEKETKFQINDTLLILGGFVTDKHPFGELYRFHSTIDKINNEMFPNINKILLLIDPSHNNDKFVEFGIKAYEWNTKSIKIQNLEKSNSFVIFKELESEIVQHIHNFGILNGIKNQYLWEKLYNLKIDKSEKKNINELLLDLNDGNDSIIRGENNVDFIKNKLEESIGYMNIFLKFLESYEIGDNETVNGDDFNNIAYIISQLDPVLNDKEIMEAINTDINKRYNIDSLAQLIEVQLVLSDKIRQLINK